MSTALTEADARSLLDTHDLIGLGMRAYAAREALHGSKTTFLRVFELHCQVLPASLPPNLAAGEIRLVGVPASPEDAIKSVRAVASLGGSAPLTGFALSDLVALAGGPGQPLREFCNRLYDAGLFAVADTAIDVLDDSAHAIESARAGHLVVDRMTVRALDPEDRVAVLTRAADLQAAVGGFAAFAPLPRTMSVSKPSTGYDDVRQVALARLMLPGVRSIQVDWALYGPKLAQVALTVGADDVDGIVAADPTALGPRRSAIEEIRGNIKAAALEPVERNARWETIGA